jgi:Protein of unknown function (DUF1592)/Protein of unknown function (DUF1588)/Protein of unknown function (DUF1595)/Protein of unknown function (DUF1587)
MRLLTLAFLLLTCTAPAADFRGFLEAHCLECHDREMKKGDLDLSLFTDEAAVMRDRSIWRSVFEKIESHQMPPPKQKSQLTESQRQELMAWIMDIAARPDAELGVADPGNPVLRRLTRLEYNNTVRDLFGLSMDVFMFPERLPLSSKAYFQLQKGSLGDSVEVPMREYGLKYPVLLPELGLPGENRAEHGYRNRGEAMNLSPMLLEQYLSAARDIVSSPKLPQLSPVFRLLVHDPAAPLKASPVIQEGEANTWTASEEFAPNLNLPFQAKDGAVSTLDYQFRFAMQTAVAEGTGGVWDATGRSTVVKAGEPIRVRFGAKALRITSAQAVWIAGFSTAGETSGESLFTNHEKQQKMLALDFEIENGAAGEGITELAVCALSRAKESGKVTLTAHFSGGGSSALSHAFITGEGVGNTFFAFRAPKNEHIVRLTLDGSKFSGNYVLFDDLAFLTDGASAVATAPAAAPEKKMSLSENRAAARERLAGFVTRAFRRPVEAKTVERYVEVYDDALDRDLLFEDAMKAALAAVLASPEFLYLSEAGVGRGSVKPLANHELASRLAYFMWSAPPDDELMHANLGDPAVLESQTRRLLRDARVCELSESFATQWLRLDQLTTAKPDPKLFKGFYSGPQGKVTLHGSMLVEALLLFETVLVEDRSILDLLAADYTWLNGRLARLYDIDVATLANTTNSNVLIDARQNSKWLRVALTDQRRGGYMTMAGPLTVTSLPVRTSPVKRGAWLLETLFNRPPQEPKVAFALKDEPSTQAAPQTVRGRFEQHRDQSACFSCHVRLDPPGFALERFDAIGAWRDKDGSQPVDARAEWQGTAFDGPAEYKALRQTSA